MLQLRPHHFLCTLGFVGKGYSDEFVRGFQELADRLRVAPDGDSVPIQVTGATDSICAPCPNKRDKLCVSQGKIQDLDDAHARVLGLEPGQVLSWGEAKALIAKHMTPERFETSCEPCSWKSMGVCKAALEKLRSESGKSRLLAWLAVGLALGAVASPAKALAAPTKPATARAAKHAPPPLPVGKLPELGPDPLPIDQIHLQLAKRAKSKQAKAIGRAIRLLRQGKFSEVRAISGALLNDELFADHAYGIHAQSFRMEAQQHVLAKAWDAAIQSARKATSLFLDLEGRQPYSPLLKKVPEELGLAELATADALYGKKNFKAAQPSYERAFQRLADENRLGLIRPESFEGYAHACAKKPGLLCGAWVQKLARASAKDSEELRALAKYYPEVADRGRTPSASRLTQAYKSSDLDVSAFDLAMGIYNDGKYGQAIKAFNQFLDEFPRSQFRFRARYWMGQALSQEQEHEKALKTNEDLMRDSPLTYYGLLASIACGKRLDSVIDAELPLATPFDPQLQPHEVLRIRRGERFLVEKAYDLALQDLREIKSRDTVSPSFLMYLASLNSEAGSYGSTFSILGDLINRGHPGVYSSYAVRMIFPTVQLERIRKHAAPLKLDPVLVLSLMKQESAFDAYAMSWVGATGLMQLMPATAVDTEPTVKRADLIDPDTNIRVGTKYLKKMMDRFNGNIAFALAAYNAGPGAVDRWIRENKARRGMLEFIEAIPYKETREYVASIIRNYYWYSIKVNGEAPKTLGYFWNVYGPPELPPSVQAEPSPAPSENSES